MPLQVEGSRIQVLGPTSSSNIVGPVRRARELSDIAPQYIAKSGLCSASEIESSRGGSIRIQHVTGLPTATEGKSRFPKLDECAHFHYEHVEIGPVQVSLVDDDDLKPLSNESDEEKWWSLSVTSQNQTWLIRRSYENFRMLDQQLHRCIYDRKFSELAELPAESCEEQENIYKLLSNYMVRFSAIAGSLINCGPVLNWLELDNRGHRLLVPDTDNCPINTPAVAAAYSVKRYTAQAPDEISFEVGDMISVIDMPPPEESIWWRGKRGFQVGFFPCECVAVIGDKVPRNLQFSPQLVQPTKPVLRKHGKLIAFFRSFILSRPSRRRLKQSGILKERVFGCDLGEHLLNSGHEIPMVLKCCVEFIEANGLVDGIYRLSGVTSNIQKLRNAFDEDRVPALYEDESILQDVHSVASLLKMYFRELPNPLCTYQLYHQFVGAVQATQGDDTRLLKMRDVVQKLPPPHYRTLEYLMRHLARVSEKGHETGMTSRNVAIVWAPNLLRCKELEVGGVAALQGVGVQAVVTEFLVCYADLIFCDKLPNFSLPPQQVNTKKSRPKSLAISTPTKLLSLEEARNRVLLQAAGKFEQDYIEVGGGPANLPAKYHTVIELSGGSRKRPGSKRSPIGWKMLFGKSGRGSQTRKGVESKASTTSDLGLRTGQAVTELDLAQSRRRLRPAKSVESLNSSRNSTTLDLTEPQIGLGNLEDTLSPMLLRNGDGKGNGHNRSVSHESYFDQLQDQKEESGLDISEIQVNFDLEESEMRIFSEDETLMSVGSGSLASNSSPRILPIQKPGKYLGSSVNKRLSYPKMTVTEDRFSSSQSADPSPKKQKTNENNPPRSKLEEQLSSSMGDIQFIDSVSPDQVLVQAEVHPIQSPSPVSSISQINSFLPTPSSPILPHIPHLRRPKSQTIVDQIFVSGDESCENKNSSSENEKKSPHEIQTHTAVSCELNHNSYVPNSNLAEANISDNENFSLQSSELTTPETPICRPYTPLVDLEESSVSNMTTPDFDYKTKNLKSEIENADSSISKLNLEFEDFQNTGKEFSKVDEKLNSDLMKVEKLTTKEIAVPKPEERKPPRIHPYVNIPMPKTKESEQPKLLETSFDLVENPEKDSNRNSVISIKYEVISTESSCDSLININKGEENSCLLGFKSSTQSPVVESTCESSKTTDIDEQKTEESEMNLLKECSDWLQSKQEFNSTQKTTDEKSLFGFSSEWFQDKDCVNSEDKSLIDERTVSQPLNISANDCSTLNISGIDYNVNEEIKKINDCDVKGDITSDSETFDEMSSVSVETVLSKNTSEEANEESNVESEVKPVDFLPKNSAVLEKKVLETNLDEIENLYTSSLSVAQKVLEKPVPKKRTLPQKSNSNGNVRLLLSKFEVSPTAEKDITELRLDFDEKKELKEQCSSGRNLKETAERPKTLERLSTKRKTDIDLSESLEVQLEKSKSGSHINEKSGKSDNLINCDFDLSDPQRRERIEKYKEKRRNYLREKYRSDSFKNDKDEFVLKIKLRHTAKGDGESTRETIESFNSPLSSPERKNPEKPLRKNLEGKSLGSPVRDPCRRSFSADISPRLRYELPTFSSSIREQSNRKNSFLRFSTERKSASDFRSVRSSPEKRNYSVDFSIATFRDSRLSPESPGPSLTRRRMTDPSKPNKSSEISSDLKTQFHRSACNVNKNDKLLTESSSTPTFCIKDMTALFEKRDNTKSHRQYLSSV